MDKITNFIKEKPLVLFAIVVVVLLVIGLIYHLIKSKSKSSFNRILNKNSVSNVPPLEFNPLTTQSGDIKLMDPVVPEEIGLAMKYPQGGGVGMNPTDSNSFYPDKPGPLLVNHVGPESYGESSLIDPIGNNGANQGARVIKIKSTGNQLNFKPVDEYIVSSYASAYSNGTVDISNSNLINGAMPLNYSDNFNPEENMNLQTSPGQESTLTNCESTYPNVVKYGNFCITEGDIPYGQVIDGKVNPRLVSRWESFTGDYSRSKALEPIDGVLYPNLNVLKNQ